MYFLERLFSVFIVFFISALAIRLNMCDLKIIATGNSGPFKHRSIIYLPNQTIRILSLNCDVIFGNQNNVRIPF